MTFHKHTDTVCGGSCNGAVTSATGASKFGKTGGRIEHRAFTPACGVYD